MYALFTIKSTLYQASVAADIDIIFCECFITVCYSSAGLKTIKFKVTRTGTI